MAAMNSASFLSLFFFFSLAVILQAHNLTFDEYWQQRYLESEIANSQAYHPNPEQVTNHINEHVFRAVHGAGNSTRRSLAKKKPTGVCQAINPIDKCWRCKKDWEKNRKTLAQCGLGFGRNAIGGIKGEIYVVTDASDHLLEPRPGTLRYGVTRTRPLWIIFERDMIITLIDELIMTSHKTIDGRGANVHIAFGAGITLQSVKNVIISNVHIHDTKKTKGNIIMDSEKHKGTRLGSDGDGITIFASSDIWIDHVSMYNCEDGLIDITMGSTAVTISNSHFTRHDDVMLFSAHDQDTMDKKMQITVAFNHFGKGLVQRMPRCRFGFFHILNNDYTHWKMYAIGGNMNPTIISQGNRYRAPKDEDRKANEITKREHHTPASEWKKWNWRSENDLMMDGAFFVESGNAKWNWPSGMDRMKIPPRHGSMVPELTRDSGTLACKPGLPC